MNGHPSSVYIDTFLDMHETCHIFPTSAPSFDVVEDWPSYWELTVEVQWFHMCLLHEFGFYVTHRMNDAQSHTSICIKNFTRSMTNTNKITSYMVAQPNTTIPSITLFPSYHPRYSIADCHSLWTPTHSVTQFQFAVWILVTNLDDHCGYSFPWSPVRWFPFASLTEQHEFHHVIHIPHGRMLRLQTRYLHDEIFDIETTHLKWSMKRAAKSHHPAKRGINESSQTSILGRRTTS